MQLSTLVLPAPLGPIRANNLPLSTAKDTSWRTVSPPKRSVRCSTASSAIPSPAAAVLLDVAVAPPAFAGLAELQFLDQQQLRHADQTAAERQHLPLAA